MGGSESTLANIEGFQVARVIPNSPAHMANLVPFFDIITAVDNMALERENSDFFRDYIKKSIGRPIVFNVFNLRIRAYRDVTIVPTDTWGGIGLLGCTINWESADRCLEYTWHIVDVAPNSPAAANADIVAQRDFLIGMQPPEEPTITMFRDTGDFHSRIESWRSLRSTNPNAPPTLLLLIYDSVDNAVKEVLVDMGRSLHLGIDVANGYLHIVPAAPGSNKLPIVKKFFVSSPVAHGSPLAAAPAPTLPPQPFPSLAEQHATTAAAAQPVAPPPVHITQTVAPPPPSAASQQPAAASSAAVEAPAAAAPPAAAPPAPVVPPAIPVSAPHFGANFPPMAPPTFPAFPTLPGGQPQFPQFPQMPPPAFPAATSH